MSIKKSNFRLMLRKFTLPMLVIMLLLVTGLTGEKISYANDGDKIVINPTPQSLVEKGEGFSLPPVVGLVIGEETDATAIREVEEALQAANVKQIERSNAGEPLPDTTVTIWLGGPSENEATAKVLKDLKVAGPEELKAEGYVLVSDVDKNGQNQIILAGKDQVGTFYAVQTFKQMIQQRSGDFWVPSAEIRDWPEMPIRGGIEGFYGPPWSHQDRLEQLRFYAENKMNAYIYAPKDDPYHRDKWREPYPNDKLMELQSLLDHANEQKITFTFAISPGNTICFSDDADFNALLDKAEAVWDLGVRSYAIFLDDIDASLRCAADRTKFQGERNAPAAAQAFLLNRFNKEFIQTHEGAERLITVPTEYSQAGTSSYRQVFADKVDPDVIVQWTGVGVVAPTITSADAEKMSGIFKHDLLIWDNYPVNDYDRNRLFLHPLVGRDPDLTEHGVIGLTANPMNEAEASKIPLYTIADYVWNPAVYDANNSWERSIQAFGGDVADALKTFAEQSYSSQLNGKESPTLTPLIEQFWATYGTENFDEAAQKLLEEFERIQDAPAILRNELKNERFLEEVSPYLDKMELYGEAVVAAVQMLTLQQNKGDESSWDQRMIVQERLEKTYKIPQKIAVNVIEPFLKQAVVKNDEWIGVLMNWTKNIAAHKPATASANEVNYLTPNLAVDGDESTRWSSGLSNNQWIYVDLLQQYPINKVVLKWEAAYASGYKIQVSNDAVNWKDVYVTNSGNGGVDEVYFAEENARYVRMLGTQRATSWGYSLYEFEVYQPNRAKDMKTLLVDNFVPEGEFNNESAARSIEVHLTAVELFEKQAAAQKVVKHMEGFKVLLDQQLQNKLISRKAHYILSIGADDLIKKWK
ncbi:beta-N-acetylglucosaminidase domain-containing protein [Sporosarcina sp. NPDC096371]|uniref:beta-N-acetylglucosaminidase domain-containing protein n=1 Tax=Sporosarcina sp. NPDC096371 TaxID=3364530 RepID=UPI0037FB3904